MKALYVIFSTLIAAVSSALSVYNLLLILENVFGADETILFPLYFILLSGVFGTTVLFIILLIVFFSVQYKKINFFGIITGGSVGLLASQLPSVLPTEDLPLHMIEPFVYQLPIVCVVLGHLLLKTPPAWMHTKGSSIGAFVGVLITYVSAQITGDYLGSLWGLSGPIFGPITHVNEKELVFAVSVSFLVGNFIGKKVQKKTLRNNS